MSNRHVIFVSAVSNEFHRCPPGKRHLFQSYRDVLKAAFRILAPHYEVILQEDLVQGTGDLLETLDGEIARSLLVVHLVGELAGARPQPASLRSLHVRHPDFLASAPELHESLGDEAEISYTQWEAYLAFHHRGHRLFFVAEPNTPRSPAFVPDENERASQERHRRRLRVADADCRPFTNQGDVARRTMRSFLHLRLDPRTDPIEPAQEALDAAWEHDHEIVQELIAAIRKPDPRAVPVTDPANVAAFVAAVRACAKKWEVNLTTIVAIAARHDEEVRAAAEHRPAPETLYDQALAELALGDYTAARHTARRAADHARRLLESEVEDVEHHRESAVNALLLLHYAAKNAHDIPAAIAALEEAGGLVDKEKDPLLWAAVHQPLASFLLDHAQYERADELISDILDIREEQQGENHRDLAVTLLLWCRLLNARANYRGMEGVAARAAGIFATQVPPNLDAIAASLGMQGVSLKEQGKLVEAEQLMRRALAIVEQSLGPDHPHVATCLSNLAMLLRDTNRMAEAEPLLRRALAIDEQCFGADHPDVACRLDNLAHVLYDTNRVAEAEPLLRRALAIHEQNFGPDHPDVGLSLNNLTRILQDTNRLAEAERLVRRALAIAEQSFGLDHPSVATCLGNLASLLRDTNRVAEAEPLLRRALAIHEQSFGPDHPDVGLSLNNVAMLLRDTNRLAEAEPLLRRALAINEQSFGSDHPTVAISLNNLAALLQDTNRPAEAEPLMRRALAIGEQNLGPDHPNVAILLNDLSALLQATDRFAEAEALLRRALAIDEASYGKDHPKVARRLNSLALFSQNARRDFTAAERDYDKALQAAPDDPIYLTNYASLRIILGRNGPAKEHLCHAWRVARRDDATCECTLFVRAALAVVEKEDSALYLGQLKTMMRSGLEPPQTTNVSFLDYLRNGLPSTEFTLFEVLFQALNSREGIAKLEDIPMWQQVNPVPLETAWPE